MSPPDTNAPKETRRHRPALIGIAVAVVLGALFFLTNLFNAADNEIDPDGGAQMTPPEATAPATPQ
ncbi:hypothetical protein [Tropicimonas aquimaris]|uniref:Conjugal transfer protein TrbI n=1 Tax=Tropicimonas aquimaris TaxID=914152 RepID=A0ABW3IJB9_9RHOB